MNYFHRTAALSLFLMILLATTGQARASLYTTKANVNLRKGPGTNHTIIRQLDQNESLSYVSRHDNWLLIQTINGTRGYLRNDMVSDLRIILHKKERKLYLVKGENKILKSYMVALSSFNPVGDKAVQGDGGTPEGRFFLCEMLRSPKKPSYGARSMRISYPSAEDARRGLKDGHISYNDYLSIINAVRNGSMPPQTTKLGGSIRIHGGGNSADWTLGCIGMDDTDIKELFGLVRRGTRVEIFRSSRHETTVSEALHLNQTILAGAQNQLKHPALYTHSASTITRLNYPMGDIPGDQAVCTDIVIRALRHAGLDLQALIHEDALMNPDRYAPDITSPDYHIDHRRTRNLYRLLSERAIRLDSTPDNARPGDIVIMDTGIPNGTIYDHIGIIDNTRDSNGSYNVINIWTTGCTTESFSLLGHAYPDIVGLFRLTHPFDY